MSTIDEVKQRLDIIDVISDYVSLKKAGRNFKALCPFHNEKTPSFFVFPERQTWHCFGSCGIGGDMFSFVMRKEGVDFGEALRMLADRAGVKLVSRQNEQKKADEWDKLYQINEEAARFYHRLLMDDARAADARDYLSKRGIKSETIEAFELGFSPDSWNALHLHLSGKGYTTGDMTKVGLIVEKEGNKPHDLFRNRIMIPIHNEHGRVAGFGARTQGGDQPKYLNSPQTAVFDKSGLLYGLDKAKNSIREHDLAIIVEGYIDVITAHQHGFKNVIAPMGTSLTEKQIGIIKRLTRKMALALDADAAGEQATLRGLEIARQALREKTSVAERDWMGSDTRLEGELKVITIPTGKDPDEVIMNDPEGWIKLVSEAVPVMDYVFRAACSRFDLSSDRGKSAAAAHLLPIISEVPNNIERELFLRRLSRAIGVDEKTLAGEAARIKPALKAKSRENITVSVSQSLVHHTEEYCLALLLQNPWLREQSAALSPEHFEGTANRELFIAWMNTADSSTLRDTLDPILQEHLDTLMKKTMPPSTQREMETALADCTRRLWEQRLRRIKTLEELLLSEVESEGDANTIREQVQSLLQKSLEPTSQLKEIFEKSRREQRGIQR